MRSYLIYIMYIYIWIHSYQNQMRSLREKDQTGNPEKQSWKKKNETEKRGTTKATKHKLRTAWMLVNRHSIVIIIDRSLTSELISYNNKKAKGNGAIPQGFLSNNQPGEEWH